MTPDTQIRAGDLLRDEYEISFHGRSFLARRVGGRIDFFPMDSQSRPLGSIRLGTDWSGAVWIGNNVIAEYEHHGQEWVVTPITAGRKDPDAITRMHPASYLLASIIKVNDAAALGG
jgi:hypothetical protein